MRLGNYCWVITNSQKYTWHPLTQHFIPCLHTHRNTCVNTQTRKGPADATGLAQLSLAPIASQTGQLTLIPRPTHPHTQANSPSYPGQLTLIPRPTHPHTQANSPSYPGQLTLIPRPTHPHTQANSPSYPGQLTLIPRPTHPHTQTNSPSYPGQLTLN